MKKIIKLAAVILLIAVIFPGAAGTLSRAIKAKKGAAQSGEESEGSPLGIGRIAAEGLERAAEALAKAGERKTVLLTGIDGSANNSDVIMLISLNGGEGATIMQIPRDSYINDPRYGFHKINSVFAYGYNRAINQQKGEKEARNAGSEELRSLLERISGVKIDYCVNIDRKGFAAIVDSVGGIEIEIPGDMDYDDDSQDLHIHFKAGKTRLNGADAEKFVRYRSGYINADYGRMDAQKLFLCAMMKKIKTELTLPQIAALCSALFSKIATDMSVSDMLSLLPEAIAIKPEQTAMITLKGRSVTSGGIMYEVQNRAYTCALFNKYFGAGIDEPDKFDPDMILCNADEPKIYGYYTDNAPFSSSAVSADQEEKIRAGIPTK